MKLTLYFLLSLLAILSLPTYADDNPGFEFFNKTSTPINIYWTEGKEPDCVKGDKINPLSIGKNQSSRVISMEIKSPSRSTGCKEHQVFEFIVKNDTSAPEVRKTHKIQIDRYWYEVDKNICTVTVAKDGDYKIDTQTGSPCSTAHFFITVYDKK